MTQSDPVVPVAFTAINGRDINVQRFILPSAEIRVSLKLNDINCVRYVQDAANGHGDSLFSNDESIL